MPRQVVARAEVLAGMGPVEAGVLAGAGGAGALLQWVAALVGRVLGLPPAPVLVARVVVALLLVGAGWVATRPAAGGRLADYLLAMARYYRRGAAPLLYGPPPTP